jgi:hypothetical protein
MKFEVEDVLVHRVREIERRAAELVKQCECALPIIELFYGEDDGRNRTFTYRKTYGWPLRHTTEVLRKLMNTGYMIPYGGGGRRLSVVGAYALSDGIVVQVHVTVLNTHGNPVKDYGSFPSLTTLLEVEKRVRAAAEEVLSAVAEDVEELERELNKHKHPRCYTIEKPYRGLVIAICPVCGKILRPRKRLPNKPLVFVHEHQPSFIVLERGEARVEGEVPEQLLEIVKVLWLKDGGRAVAEIEKVTQVWLRQRREREYEEAMRAFFLSLA